LKSHKHTQRTLFHYFSTAALSKSAFLTRFEISTATTTKYFSGRIFFDFSFYILTDFYLDEIRCLLCLALHNLLILRIFFCIISFKSFEAFLPSIRLFLANWYTVKLICFPDSLHSIVYCYKALANSARHKRLRTLNDTITIIKVGRGLVRNK